MGAKATLPYIATAGTTATATLRLQIASDIHSEFYASAAPDNAIIPQARYLALLGDIGIAFDPRYEAFIATQASRFEKVLVIAGNHEYYQLTTQQQQRRSVAECNEEIARVCAKWPNVIFLNQTSMMLDGVRVLGAVLWTHVPPQCWEEVGDQLNDYRVIYKTATETVTVHDTTEWHRQTVNWIKSEIAQSLARNEQHMIVLTHHAPYMHGVSDPQFEDGLLSSGFSTDLRHLFRASGSNIHTWVYGHTHYNNDQTVDGTRLVSNMRGYAHEVDKAYDPGKVVEVAVQRSVPHDEL
eukprot:TRINITY_DN3120_c0_g1_i3.p1 TRINITY_DN3120_c0_g1~~TRINITY_DN3120_c0_g1_i3.p1  ORF type:complete len:296 (-),score=52.96 TRINITY_DN3120_c0_g1_i3:31-918(-)